MKKLFMRLFSRSKKAPVSLTGIILFFFIPTITISILASGIANYYFTTKHIQSLVSQNSYNTVKQASAYVQSNLFKVFEQFVKLEQYQTNVNVLSYIDENGEYTVSRDFMSRLYVAIDDTYTQNYDMIDGIFVGFEFPDGTTKYGYYSSDNVKNINFSFDNSIGEHQLTGRDSPCIWTDLHYDGIMPLNHPKNVVTLYRELYDEATKIKTLIYFNLNSSFFQNVFNDNVLLENNYFTIIGDNGLINFSGIEDERLVPDSNIQKLNLDGKSHTVYTEDNSGEQVLITYDTISLNKWKLASIVKMDYIRSYSSSVRTVVFFVAAIVIFFLLLLTFFFARLITNPINKWMKKIKTINNDDFDITFDENICFEMSQINDGLNHLVSVVKKLLDDKENENQQRRALEMSLLQQQINPHFLYNTLFSIQQLYDLGENKLAGKMVSDLSAFFRLSLSKGREIITVADELEHIVKYLDIQKVRYEKIDYTINVDTDILKCRILKLSLQPLIENAIYHGLFSLGKGNIDVSGNMENDNVIIKIADDGAGIDPDLLDMLNECLDCGNWEQLPEVYGVKNVHERIKLYFGNGYGLYYESVLGSGTTVYLKIPFSIIDG